jgi:TPR repeat protein
MSGTTEEYGELWESFRRDNRQLFEAIDGDEWDVAIPTLRSLASSGDIRAESILGACYWLGLGVEKDSRVAIRMLRHAAEAGSALAAHNLATLYACGSADVNCDPKEAARYLELSRTLGSPHRASVTPEDE